MVISLQVALKASPLNGLLAKLQSRGSQPVSFGDILNAKEKQLEDEQTVNAASLIAALAVLQTKTLPAPVNQPEVKAGAGTVQADLQPATLSVETRPIIASTQPRTAPSVIQAASGPETLPANPQADETRSATAALPVELPQPGNIVSQPLETPSHGKTTVTPHVDLKRPGKPATKPDAFQRASTSIDSPAEAKSVAQKAPVVSKEKVEVTLEKPVIQPKAAKAQVETVTESTDKNIDKPGVIAPQTDLSQLSETITKPDVSPNTSTSGDIPTEPKTIAQKTPAASNEKVETASEKPVTQPESVKAQAATKSSIGNIQSMDTAPAPARKIIETPKATADVQQMSFYRESIDGNIEFSEQIYTAANANEVLPAQSETTPRKVAFNIKQMIVSQPASDNLDVEIPKPPAEVQQASSFVTSLENEIDFSEQTNVSTTAVAAKEVQPAQNATTPKNAVFKKQVLPQETSSDLIVETSKVVPEIQQTNSPVLSVDSDVDFSRQTDIPATENKTQSAPIESDQGINISDAKQVEKLPQFDAPTVDEPIPTFDSPVFAKLSSGKSVNAGIIEFKEQVSAPQQNRPIEHEVFQKLAAPEAKRANAKTPTFETAQTFSDAATTTAIPSGKQLDREAAEASALPDYQPVSVETDQKQVEPEVARSNARAQLIGEVIEQQSSPEIPQKSVGSEERQDNTKTLAAKPTQIFPETVAPAMANLVKNLDEKGVISSVLPKSQSTSVEFDQKQAAPEVTQTKTQTRLSDIVNEQQATPETPSRPVVITNAESDKPKETVKKSIVSTETPAVSVSQPAPKPSIAQVDVKPEKPVGETRASERKVVVDTAVIPQTDVSTAKDAQNISPDKTGNEAQSTVLPDFKSRLENAKVQLPDKPQDTEKLPFGAAPAGQQFAPSAVSSDGTHSASEIGKTVQARPASGKSTAPEKQQETGRGVDAPVTATQPTRETFVAKMADREPMAQVNARGADVVQQIVHHLNARLQAGPNTMRLQLNPKELGEIDVQMVSGPQGVTITFSAEQPGTSRLLETQMNQLRQSLADAGIQLSGLNIGQHSQPRQEGGSWNQNPQFTGAPRQEAVSRELDVPVSVQLERTRSKAGEVDYLI